MEVAVSGVPPAAGRQPVPRADLERPLDGLRESVQRDDDVLADLAAALRRHRDRHALAPAPERGYLYRGGRHVERLGAVGERLTELGLEPARLAGGAVGLRDHHEAGRLGHGRRETSARGVWCARARV